MIDVFSPPPFRRWFTAAELAKRALPGLPATTRGVQLFATRWGWRYNTELCRQRAGKGGGFEYHARILPDSAVAVLSAQTAGTPTPEATEGQLYVAHGRDRLAAKLVILAACDAFTEIYGDCRPPTRSHRRFAQLYTDGAVPLPTGVLVLIKTLSVPTLARWYAARAQQRHQDLAGRYGNRKGSGAWSDLAPVRDALFALATEHPEWSVNRCRHRLRARFGDPVCLDRPDGSRFIGKLPSLRSMQAQIRAWAAVHKPASLPDLGSSVLATANSKKRSATIIPLRDRGNGHQHSEAPSPHRPTGDHRPVATLRLVKPLPSSDHTTASA